MKKKAMILLSVAAAALVMAACEKEKTEPTESRELTPVSITRWVDLVDENTPYEAPAYDTAAALEGRVWRAEGLHRTGYPVVSTEEYDSADCHVTMTTYARLPYCVTLTFSDSTHCVSSVVRNGHSAAGQLGLFDDDEAAFEFAIHRNDTLLGSESTTDYVEIISPATVTPAFRYMILESLTDSSATISSVLDLADETIRNYRFVRVDPATYTPQYK